MLRDPEEGTQALEKLKAHPLIERERPPEDEPQDGPAVLHHLAIGLSITAVAVTFGAPFWFDTLSKLARLRTSGAPPPASDAVRHSEGEERPPRGPHRARYRARRSDPSAGSEASSGEVASLKS